jgi:hypothetical protein
MYIYRRERMNTWTVCAATRSIDGKDAAPVTKAFNAKLSTVRIIGARAQCSLLRCVNITIANGRRNAFCVHERYIVDRCVDTTIVRRRIFLSRKNVKSVRRKYTWTIYVLRILKNNSVLCVYWSDVHVKHIGEGSAAVIIFVSDGRI